jgi:hypothetical protein
MKTKSLRLLFLLFILSFVFGACKKDEPVEPTFSKVIISKVTVLQFEDVDSNGDLWDDPIDDADVYFNVTYAGTNTSIFKLDPSNRYLNVDNSNVPLIWNPSTGILINSLYNPIDVDLWDYDNLSDDDYIGSCRYNFSNYITGSDKYPTSVTTQSGANLIKLDLIWTN